MARAILDQHILKLYELGGKPEERFPSDSHFKAHQRDPPVYGTHLLILYESETGFIESDSTDEAIRWQCIEDKLINSDTTFEKVVQTQKAPEGSVGSLARGIHRKYNPIDNVISMPHDTNPRYKAILFQEGESLQKLILDLF